MVFYYHMIYYPETNNQSETLVTLHLLYTMKHGLLFHNVTYSVHDEFLMSHLARLVVLLVPPMDALSPLLLQINCLSGSPLGGPGPVSTPLPMVTPFPSRSTHSLISPSATPIVFLTKIYDNTFPLTLIVPGTGQS
jgi:hypothetical protein